MTGADMIYCIVYQLSRSIIEYFPRAMCGPYYMSVWTSQMASISFLLALNVDKFMYIQYPLQYPLWINDRRILGVCVTLWTGIVGVAGFSYYGTVMVG
jgi:hypothetical protein